MKDREFSPSSLDGQLCDWYEARMKGYSPSSAAKMAARPFAAVYDPAFNQMSIEERDRQGRIVWESLYPDYKPWKSQYVPCWA